MSDRYLGSGSTGLQISCSTTELHRRAPHDRSKNVTSATPVATPIDDDGRASTLAADERKGVGLTLVPAHAGWPLAELETLLGKPRTTSEPGTVAAPHSSPPVGRGGHLLLEHETAAHGSEMSEWRQSSPGMGCKPPGQAGAEATAGASREATGCDGQTGYLPPSISAAQVVARFDARLMVARALVTR